MPHGLRRRDRGVEVPDLIEPANPLHRDPPDWPPGADLRAREGPAPPGKPEANNTHARVFWGSQ